MTQFTDVSQNDRSVSEVAARRGRLREWMHAASLLLRLKKLALLTNRGRPRRRSPGMLIAAHAAMSKIVMVCLRRPRDIRPALESFLRSLCPDNLEPAHVVSDDARGLHLGVYRPHRPVEANTAYVGWLREDGNGSYALFKGGDDTIELVADAAASRTIWMAASSEVFVASTSQRAIPYFMGSFQPDPSAAAWMLSSGCIGPAVSWDARARPLGPYGRARFDRRQWRLTVDEPDTDLQPRRGTRSEHRARIEAAVSHACAGRFDGFAVCLSGGRDSRNIVQRIDRTALTAITWGRPEALDNPESDAAIARRLAQHYGLEHQYFSTELPDEPIERVLDRFVSCSEGRVDHLAGYTDGFALWKRLAESGIRGIIRGDNLFGCSAARTPDEAAAEAGLLTLESMRTSVPLRELGLEHLATPMPPHLALRAGERGQDWYHRLMHAFRHPTIIAALNEIKAAYVEVANPLNIDTCVDVARSLPSALRDHKKLFNSMADSNIPFARDAAIGSPDETIGGFTELLADELRSARTAHNFSSRFGAHLADRLQAQAPPPRKRSKLRRVIGRAIPAALRHRLGRVDTRLVSARKLALRVYLTNAMLERLSRDAGALDRSTLRRAG
jgi:hypothetical protein